MRHFNIGSWEANFSKTLADDDHTSRTLLDIFHVCYDNELAYLVGSFYSNEDFLKYESKIYCDSCNTHMPGIIKVKLFQWVTQHPTEVDF